MNENEKNSNSKTVSITFFENGDTDFDIPEGVTAVMLYGIAGTLSLIANSKTASAMARSAAVAPSGLVVPGRD